MIFFQEFDFFNNYHKFEFLKFIKIFGFWKLNLLIEMFTKLNYFLNNFKNHFVTYKEITLEWVPN